MDVVCATMNPVTKAGISGVKPGEDAYDENIIKTIDYYFYPEGKTDQPAVLHASVSPNALNQYTVNVSIDEGMLNTILFPRPVNTCQVAVLVNYPGDHPAATTVAGLEALSLVLQLTDDGKGKDQSEFVMFGVQEVELISRKATLIANPVVDVHRVACKITLDAYVVPSTIAPVQLIDGGTTYTLRQEWQPILDQMYIYLENGVSNGVVNGDQEVTKPYNYFKYSQRPFTGEMATHKINGVDHEFHKSFPFYTYPQNWATADPKEPFLKLILPWTRVAGDDHEYNPDWETKPHTWGSIQKQFYYRILLPHDATGFVSNNWYHINLDVAILGSDIDDASVDIEGTYYVVPWGDPISVEADIKGSRYLSVSQLNHIMYNTTRLEIPYVTSNKCSIVNLSVRQYDFKSRTYVNRTTAATTGHWVSLDENNNIVINHTLNNDITSDSFDVAPYEYTFRIRHEDTPDGDPYYRDITVLQYPAMYIVQDLSNGFTFVKGVDNVSHTTDQYDRRAIWDGNGIGNGSSPRTPNATNIDRFMGSMTTRSLVDGSGDNNNQYQYAIHVTVLPEGSSWSIGDPRDVAQTLDGLPDCANYKPTSENTKDIISPVFRIASSYGKTSYITYEGAQKRCAAYQENGYPAGRWRLPTKAEIEYLVNLSAKGKIPTLFGSGTAGYWAAGGEFYVADELAFHKASDLTLSVQRANFTDGGELYVAYYGNYHVVSRCVYDEWYWGSDKVVTDDTWAGYKTTF